MFCWDTNRVEIDAVASTFVLHLVSFLHTFCLSPSEWPVYLSWFIGSEWARLGSNWRLCWYERVSESVWKKGGRKETRLQWRSHLRPQLMRNRSGGSGWEKARRECLYSVPRFIDSFALALFWLHALNFSSVSATYAGLLTLQQPIWATFTMTASDKGHFNHVYRFICMCTQ